MYKRQGLYRTPPYVACKVPVFSFEKLTNVDVALGPEMKSTGEVLGIGKNLEEALYKGLVAAGYNMEKKGGVLVTVRDSDKHEIVDVARKYAELGFEMCIRDRSGPSGHRVGGVGLPHGSAV